MDQMNAPPSQPSARATFSASASSASSSPWQRRLRQRDCPEAGARRRTGRRWRSSFCRWDRCFTHWSWRKALTGCVVFTMRAHAPLLSRRHWAVVESAGVRSAARLADVFHIGLLDAPFRARRNFARSPVVVVVEIAKLIDIAVGMRQTLARAPRRRSPHDERSGGSPNARSACSSLSCLSSALTSSTGVYFHAAEAAAHSRKIRWVWDRRGPRGACSVAVDVFSHVGRLLGGLRALAPWPRRVLLRTTELWLRLGTTSACFAFRFPFSRATSSSTPDFLWFIASVLHRSVPPAVLRGAATAALTES